LSKVFLTFDVEDFINPISMDALKTILAMFEKHDLRALFFVTGHVTEKMDAYPDIKEMLQAHEIGYHSSSHSVRPTIPEFTDTESYSEAYAKSMKRETSHINPVTGDLEGEGGILILEKVFNRKIKAYRAPGGCWSPPHTEAIRDLGIEFDFSANISSKPVFHKGVTFYPYMMLGEWNGRKSEHLRALYSILTQEYTVIDVHPNSLVCQNMWDSNYYHGNPLQLVESRQRDTLQVKSLVKSFDRLLRQIAGLRKLRIAKVMPELSKAENQLILSRDDIEKIYEFSVGWTKKYFEYEPRFLRSHFFKFFSR
jgi:peptidoglycan/xylan/chitin deacetylase (PgdA/CDA1 family)